MKQMETLAAMQAQRSVLEATGVEFDRIANYQPLWTHRAGRGSNPLTR
jgi:hypothetical protein